MVLMSSMQGLLNVAVYAMGHKTFLRYLHEGGAALWPGGGGGEGGVSAPLLSPGGEAGRRRPKWMLPTPVHDNSNDKNDNSNSNNNYNKHNDTITPAITTTSNDNNDNNAESNSNSQFGRMSVSCRGGSQDLEEESKKQSSKDKHKQQHKDSNTTTTTTSTNNKFSRLGTPEKAVRFAVD